MGAPLSGASAGKAQVIEGGAVRPALQLVAVEDVDAALPGGPAHVLPAEGSSVADDSHEAVHPGTARLPQGCGTGRAFILVRRHRAERDVEPAGRGRRGEASRARSGW